MLRIFFPSIDIFPFVCALLHVPLSPRASVPLFRQAAMLLSLCPMGSDLSTICWDNRQSQCICLSAHQWGLSVCGLFYQGSHVLLQWPLNLSGGFAEHQLTCFVKWTTGSSNASARVPSNGVCHLWSISPGKLSQIVLNCHRFGLFYKESHSKFSCNHH